jgi:hypothetical protein
VEWSLEADLVRCGSRHVPIRPCVASFLPCPQRATASLPHMLLHFIGATEYLVPTTVRAGNQTAA